MLPIDPPLAKPKLSRTLTGARRSADIPAHISDLVDEMFDADGASQAQLARMVLAYDRENIEAFTVLAEHAQSVAERVTLLREAVRIGNRLWTPALNGAKCSWCERRFNLYNEIEIFRRTVDATIERSYCDPKFFWNIVDANPCDFPRTMLIRRDSHKGNVGVSR